MILAIDPGNTQSAYALLDAELRPVSFGIMLNEMLLEKLYSQEFYYDDLAIEMVASYGMPVGREVFDTVLWIGRFYEAAHGDKHLVFRMEEKINLCHDSRAKDANIRQALIDRFGPVGTKKDPGWFYGVKKDVWAAIAVGVTLADKLKGEDHD